MCCVFGSGRRKEEKEYRKEEKEGIQEGIQGRKEEKEGIQEGIQGTRDLTFSFDPFPRPSYPFPRPSYLLSHVGFYGRWFVC